MDHPTHYMKLALGLARQGLGQVEPNPAVGCVIVKDGRIIGQGFHERFGGPHAEINALADCRARGGDPTGATLYVTLEPCSHTGKTPPCTEAVLAATIGTVVIAAEDPTEQAGGGIERLKAAGVTVQVGLCAAAAEQLNAPFYKHARTGRPWVIVKWAQSLDGKLAWANPPRDGGWISNEQSRSDVHRLRRKTQAILTGVDTVITDNPRLTVRIPGQAVVRPPLRVVIDSRLRTPWDCRLITVHDAPTVIVTTHQTAQTEFQQVEKLRQAGVDVITVADRDGHCDLDETLAQLGAAGVQQLLVEAGPTLIAECLSRQLADEVRVYTAPLILGKDGAADLSDPLNRAVRFRPLEAVTLTPFGQDSCLSGRFREPGHA